MVLFLTGAPIKLIISIIPDELVYYVHTIQIGMKMSMMVLVVTSFVYRYVLVCRFNELNFRKMTPF
jgi:hypothetical protein